jgi:integrase/recombinase XerD
MLTWAVNRDLVESNPSTDVQRLRYSSTGHHTWTVGEVDQLEVRHPVGSKARLALALHRTPVAVELSISAELSTVLNAGAIGDLTFLVTDYRKRFSAAGFGQWFRQWCNEAGLPHCSAHGLRKAGAACAEENGATAHEPMALLLSLAEAQRDTRAADRRVLAKNATRLLARRQENE